jgi:hypothetical protein
MKPSRLDAPGIREKVVRDLDLGRNKAEIAREVGLSRSQVSRYSQREDVRAELENLWMRLVEVAPDAVTNMQTLVRGMKKSKNVKDRELAYKASLKVLEGTGILPSQAPTVLVQNIINNQTNIMDARSQEILSRYMAEDVLDAEVVEE